MIDYHNLIRTHSKGSFESACLDVFRFQYQHNDIYHQFVDLISLGREVEQLEEIPFLPVSFFKTHLVCTAVDPARAWKMFLSSGTTGSHRSRHLLHQPDVYLHSLVHGFEYFYGPLDQYVILALTPTPKEQPQSSLVFMLQEMITRTNHPASGFYLHRQEELRNVIKTPDRSKKRFLFGLAYALLDFATVLPEDMPEMVVMETGGMKGKRPEITREELHAELCRTYRQQVIHSEYGMTELLSQAYAKGKGMFQTPPWMQIRIRDLDDPGKEAITEKSGIIQVVDLANLYSCSFIETEDLGKKHADGTIEVMGRADHSEARGCNLMI